MSIDISEGDSANAHRTRKNQMSSLPGVSRTQATHWGQQSNPQTLEMGNENGS